MKIIDPSYEILTKISENAVDELMLIERSGRVAYQTGEKISPDGETAKEFVKMIINRGHESVLEHSSLTVSFICDRGVSHELVRHRMASFTQESTRYVNYMNEKKAPEGVVFIRPLFYEESDQRYKEWKTGCEDAEFWYFQALKRGATPQQARTVLNNSVKTELVMTANYREWRHVLKLRTDTPAHPQMRQITIPLLRELQSKIPVVFDDILEKGE